MTHHPTRKMTKEHTMGYTHYWREGADTQQWKDAFATLTLDAKKIIEASDVKIADGLGEGKPELTEGLIRFNGATPEGYETFSLTYGLDGFDFCKTAERPYDEVVTAVLIRAKALAPAGIVVESDGTWDEWKDGRALYERVFGASAVCPFEVSA